MDWEVRGLAAGLLPGTGSVGRDSCGRDQLEVPLVGLGLDGAGCEGMVAGELESFDVLGEELSCSVRLLLICLKGFMARSKLVCQKHVKNQIKDSWIFFGRMSSSRRFSRFV